LTRLAIFDLDGTLIDSVDDLAAAVNHALAIVGLPPRTREEVRCFIGDGPRLLLERAVGQHQEKVEQALTAWREYYSLHLLDRTRAYPGIVETLAAAQCTLAVQTNKPGPAARRILEGLGLLSRFAVVLGGGEVPPKPDPSGARRILESVGAQPKDSIFVGDSSVDALTARNAGLTFVAVTWGLVPRQDLIHAGAVHFVDDSTELRHWLE